MLLPIPLEKNLHKDYASPSIQSEPLKGHTLTLGPHDLDLAKPVDYRKVFNMMAIGLFEGLKPPFLAGSFREIPACIQSYEEVASILRNSTDAEGYYRFNQAASLLKKLEGVPFPGYDPTARAIEGWFTSEEKCRETNKAIWEVLQQPLSTWDTPLASTIRSVKTEIESLLGDIPPEIDEWLEFGQFGPGVSLSTDRECLDPVLKAINPSCLPSLRTHLREVYERTLMGDIVVAAGYELKDTHGLGRERLSAMALELTEFYSHARLTTVPKNYVTERCIEIGGSMSTWLQQSLDGWIRRRLHSKWGLDLNDQSLNQHLAFLGSLETRFKNLCTIDLTSASDRISYGLVVSLVPKQWARLLTAMTNRTTLVDGEVIKLEKFSAMGNALTFSLQTAIFGGLVRSVLREQHSNQKWRVYGDDIIVEESIYDQVIDGLRVLGFEPNPKKSYSQGFFRESCGADYLCGTPVRALYIKEPIKKVPDVYKYLNLIQLHVKEAPGRSQWYKPLYEYLLSLLPASWRVFGSPSKCLDGYVWVPEMGPSFFRHTPTYVLLKCNVGESIHDDQFAMWRALLVQRNGDSSIKAAKPAQSLPGDPITWTTQAGRKSLLEYVGLLEKKHSRASIALSTELWCRNRRGMRLDPLEWGSGKGGINPLIF